MAKAKVVGVGEFAVSNNPKDVIKTFALGSCVAVIFLHKPSRTVGMIHVALPDSSINPSIMTSRPGYFADTGIPAILKKISMLTKESSNLSQGMVVKLVGGANVMDANNTFNIGKRNVLTLKRLLWSLGMGPIAEDVGGEHQPNSERACGYRTDHYYKSAKGGVADMNKDEKQAAVLAAIKEVPLISTAASRLLEIGSDPDHGLDEVVKIVKHDASLTTQVLRVVNSAAYSRGATIQSIDRAVSLLGEDIVVGIVMSEAASGLFDKKLDGYAAAEGSLWLHDLKSAIAAKMVAKYSGGKVNGELAFTCGLLHDLGKAVLSDFLKNTPEKIQQALVQGKVSDYAAAERLILGLDHAEVGYELSLAWNLPEPLPQVIRYHHHPDKADEDIRALIYTVHLGDIVAMMSGAGTGADTLQYTLDKAYEKYIDLTEDQLALVMFEVEHEFATVAEAFMGEGKEGE